MDAGPTEALYLVVEDDRALQTAVTLPPGVCVVGAGPEAGLKVDAAGVAARHLLVESNGTQVWAQPIDGAEVRLNGVVLAGRTDVVAGDRLEAGRATLVLRAGEWESKRDTAHRPALDRKTLELAGVNELQPGELIDGRYRVLDHLAQGGMGDVFRVRHEELGRQFALKVMRQELSASPDFVERFRREAIATSRIGHPNIVDITDFGQTGGGAFYFVMELLDGPTLTQVLAAGEPMPLERVLRLARQLCGALGAAHAVGVVHRDLKPDNIVLVERFDQPDVVKVLDFGIAKVDRGLAIGTETGIGVVVGTPQYMSPEQASGKAVDLRTDIYALGLILYELLAGAPAFSAETPPLLMFKQIHTPVPPLPAEVVRRVPEALVQTVYWMLQKDPAERPATMNEVLQRISGASPVTLQPAPALPRPARAATPTRIDTLGGKGRVEARARVAEPAPEVVAPKTWRVRLATVAIGVVTLATASQALRSSPPEPHVPPPAAPMVQPVKVQPPTATLPAPPVSVVVELRSDPPGAELRVDGRPIGVAPVSTRLTRDTPVRLTAQLKGHRTEQRDVTPTEATTLQFRMVKEPAPAPLRATPKPVEAPAPAAKPSLKLAEDDDLKELE